MKKSILGVELETETSTDELKSIVSAIQDAAARAGANETSNRNAFPLRPSSALKSLRDLYYGLVNYYAPGTIPTTDIEGRNSMLLGLGHVIEKHLVQAIERSYQIPFKAQVVEYGYIRKRKGLELITLSGELDFVIKLASGEEVICDSKSSADFPFKKGDLPKEEHIAQINLYLHSKWAQDRKIKRAFIFYYNKNDSNIKLCEFRYKPELAEQTIARFQRVYDMYEAGEVPPQEHILGVDWQASYSAFRDFQWQLYTSKFVRPLKTLTDIETFALPRDRKELLKYVVLNYGNAHITTADGRNMWAEKQGNTMCLQCIDADGFSS